MRRRPRGPDGYSEGSAQARSAWETLYDAHPAGYVHVDAEDGGPTYFGEDEEGRPRWSFTVSAVHLSVRDYHPLPALGFALLTLGALSMKNNRFALWSAMAFLSGVIATWLLTVPPAKATTKLPSWEHQCFKGPPEVKRLNEELDKNGAEGWELVTANAGIYCMKRANH